MGSFLPYGAAIARPNPVFRPCDNTRTDWVQDNVAADFEKMGVFLYEHGFVPALEEVTCSPVPLIESLRVESIQLSHADREVAIRRLNENVVVIAYEAVSVTDPVVALIDPFKSIKKVFSIVIVPEDGFSLVTAAGHVINSAWVFYAEGTYHVRAV
jgi:hypothetical protein